MHSPAICRLVIDRFLIYQMSFLLVLSIPWGYVFTNDRRGLSMTVVPLSESFVVSKNISNRANKIATSKIASANIQNNLSRSKP